MLVCRVCPSKSRDFRAVDKLYVHVGFTEIVAFNYIGSCDHCREGQAVILCHLAARCLPLLVQIVPSERGIPVKEVSHWLTNMSHSGCKARVLAVSQQEREENDGTERLMRGTYVTYKRLLYPSALDITNLLGLHFTDNYNCGNNVVRSLVSIGCYHQCCCPGNGKSSGLAQMVW